VIDTPDATEIRLAELRVINAKEAMRDQVALATASLKARVARSSIPLVFAMALLSGSFWLVRALRPRGYRNVKTRANHRSSVLAAILGVGVRHMAPVLVRRVAQMWLDVGRHTRSAPPRDYPRDNITG
jgi:hypothetical protein